MPFEPDDFGKAFEMTSFKRVRALAASAFGLAASALLGGAAIAHHSYAAFDRETNATIEGVVERVEWSNPHVTLSVRTDDAALYEVQWWNIRRLERAGIYANPFDVGDRVVISGAPNRDPDTLMVTLLTEVRRPADNW
jgi:hypothetical protein